MYQRFLFLIKLEASDRHTRLKLAKYQVKFKQHPEAELLLLQNYSLSSSTLSSKNNIGDILKSVQ